MINNLEAINLQEREQRRRILLRISAIIAGLLAVSAIIAGFLSYNQPGFWPTLGAIIGILVASLLAFGLARTGQLAVGTHVLFVAIDAGLIIPAINTTETTMMTLVALCAPIVGAALLLQPRWTFGYAALAVAAYIIVISVANANQPSDTFATELASKVFFSSFCYGVIAALAFGTAQHLQHLLNSSMIYARDLENARGNLEQRVAERTSEIEQALADLQRSHTTIEQLNVPLLPIAEGVLMLPLVGAIDTQRANSITQQVLETVHRQHAHTVLLDVTAIAMIDTYVARMVLDLTQSIRLLGAEAVLVGVQAATAQTLIDLGVHVAGLVVHRDVRSGLAYALHRTPNQMLTM